MIDRNGNEEVIEHNGAGQALTVLARTNRQLRPGEPDYLTQHVYNSDGELLETTLPAGNRHVFVWDSEADLYEHGNLVQVRLVADPLSGGGRGDGHGHDAADIVWTFAHEPVGNQLLTAHDPLGRTTSIQYDYQEGNPTATGLAQMAARYAIDLSGTPLELGDLNGDGRLDQIAGRVIRFEVPSVGLDPSSEQAGIEGDLVQEIVTLRVHDDHGQLVSEVDPEGNVHTIAYHPEIDPDGDGVATPPPADGRTLSSSGGGYPHRFVWDSQADTGRNNRTNPPPVAAQVDLAYDPRGNVVRLIDPRGVASEWTHNALDQVVEHRSATATFPLTGRGEGGLAPLGFRTRYAYDSNDNVVLIEREDVGESRAVGSYAEQAFVVDALDNVVAEQRELTTGIDVEYRYAYDPNENRVRETTPEGVAHQFAWDERDLPLSTNAGASGPRGRRVARSYVFDGNANLVRVVDGRGGLTDFAHDGFDRRVRAIDQIGNTGDIFYDAAGNVVRTLARGPIGGPTPLDRSGTLNVDLEDTLFAHDALDRVTRIDRRLFVPLGAMPARPPVLLEGPLVPADGAVN